MTMHTSELSTLHAALDAVCGGIDAREPELQALVPEPGRRERLRREAAALLARFPRPESRPPLFGVLVGVKDIVSVDGFATRAGSRLPPELFVGPEASCVTALRRAGALVLSKTVTTEFAYFEPGPTRNPHNPAHTPGGSSSGSAAAVAAGYCPLALGTQTIGSVIRPASYCGVVGFKPTFGRIPTDGVVPWSPSADHVGLFAPDVASVARAAAVLCAGWRAVAVAGRPALGVPEGPYLRQAEPEALAVFEEQMRRLAAAGWQVRRVPALRDITPITERHRRMTIAEAASVHAAWFEAYGALYRPRTAAAIREGRDVPPEELAAARAGRLTLRAGLEGLMEAAGIDLWATPAATGPAPRGLDSTGNPAMSVPWTHAGMPALSLPAGTLGGLPLGLQLTARAGQDEALLAWAAAVADAITGRQADRVRG
jgi:Asp-tRNA(Asn)/Glu-tRNA(Gln) amidotransferase A subunit family amidase